MILVQLVLNQSYKVSDLYKFVSYR